MTGAGTNAWGNEQTQFFFQLTPDHVLEAVEALGLQPTRFCMALNSFENRVYEVELESEEKPKTPSENRRVLKFYRPGRWSREQILEEHRFLLDLQEAEIPVIAPLRFPNGETLQPMSDTGIWFAAFPKVGGRAPDELTDEQLRRLGRLLARIHNVGAAREAPHRVRIGPETYALGNLEYLLRQEWIPVEFRGRYEQVVHSICDRVRPWFEGLRAHRIHGDCHLGNLLWNDAGPFFLDFDDMLIGPAVQDIWLLLPGRGAEGAGGLESLLEGYEEMRAFDRTTLRLMEPLRALRFIHYTAWIARRWQDPAFPRAFPQFGTHRYWSDETDDLERQYRLIMEKEGNF